jgi:hypothetical protein
MLRSFDKSSFIRSVAYAFIAGLLAVVAMFMDIGFVKQVFVSMPEPAQLMLTVFVTAALAGGARAFDGKLAKK